MFDIAISYQNDRAMIQRKALYRASDRDQCVELKAMDTIVLNPDPVPDMEIDLAGIFENQPGSRIQTHGNSIPRALHVRLLDLVADHGTADGTCDRGSRIATTAPDLMTDHAASDAAEQRADIHRLIVGCAEDLN